MSHFLEEQFDDLHLPDLPGVYLFYNTQKELVYVGKATSLKKRVRSYFRIKKVTRPIESMMHEVVTIKHKQTDSVLEAVILEANTIKEYLPKYNVLGKDNRSWNYIVITKDEYPQIKTIRQHEFELRKRAEKQGKQFDADDAMNLKQFAEVFGPYPGLNTVAALKILRGIFHYSSCVSSRVGASKKNRPCLYYQMGQCLGVCVGAISPSEYKTKVIRPLSLFLRGQKKKLIAELLKKMERLSKGENFEEAARVRDMLLALQKIHDVTLINRDMVGLGETGVKKLFGEQVASEMHVTRIEGYDISNLGSTEKVASMVVFDSAGPVKSEYRKFKIKTVEGQSDVDCMEEVMRRRFAHAEWQFPSMLLIDGGRPQVNRVDKVLRELHIFIPIVGIAKGPERKKNEFTFPPSVFENADKVAKDVLEARRKFVNFVNENQELLIRTRDEAHRFAITFQRKLRKISR